MYLVLGKKRRKHVRDIARREFIRCLNSGVPAARAVVLAEDRIRREYSSIVGAILASIAIKLATALIMGWIEDQIRCPSSEYQENEPGYSK